MNHTRRGHTRTLEHVADFSTPIPTGRVRYTCSCGYVGNWYAYGAGAYGVSSDDAETAAVEDGDEHLSSLS